MYKSMKKKSLLGAVYQTLMTSYSFNSIRKNYCGNTNKYLLIQLVYWGFVEKTNIQYKKKMWYDCLLDNSPQETK